LNKIANQYAAVIIDTRPSFSLLTEMGLLAATDAIVPVEPRYLEAVGLTSVIQKINDIGDGWRHPNLRVNRNLRRLNEARRLLLETNLTVQAVAYEVGFSSAQELNQLFLREDHVTPTQFRQRFGEDIRKSVQG